MKQPRKLKRDEKVAMSAYGLNVKDWMHLDDVSESYFKAIHKKTQKTKIIDRFAKPKKGR